MDILAESNMLFDVIGIAIAFVAVMLMLSLIVTGIVQFLQSLLHIRTLNLHLGVKSALVRVFGKDKYDEMAAKAWDILESPLRRNANDDRKDTGDKTEDKIKILRNLNQIFQMGRTWIKNEELIAGVETHCKASLDNYREDAETDAKAKEELRQEVEAAVRREKPYLSKEDFDEAVEAAQKKISESDVARKVAELVDRKKADVVKEFENLEGFLRKRFGLRVRFLSFACGLVVAFYFQVSAPGLIQDISTDSELRAELILKAEGLAIDDEGMIVEAQSYEDVSDEALEELEEMYPDVDTLIEEASGIGGNRYEIIAELRSVLSRIDSSKRRKIIEDYESLLDDLHRQNMAEALDQMLYYKDELATFNITPWRYGNGFYSSFGNWMGVLLTAIFLSFGANFWFERLRELIKLRDVLSPGNKTKNGKSAKDGNSEETRSTS